MRKKQKGRVSSKNDVSKEVEEEVEWEGLIPNENTLDIGSSDKVSDELPPFSAVQAIFADTQHKKTVKKSKKQVEVAREKDSDEEGTDEEESEEEEREEEEEGLKKRKGKRLVKSGIFAKASNTKLTKSMLHAHAMLDVDQIKEGRDVSFHELTFNLLVAGEIEIILSKISPAEKWTRLNLIKKLAYKSQFLDVKVLLDVYAGFIRKVEKGLIEWGAQPPLRDLEENLRFRTFTAISKAVDNKSDKQKSKFERSNRNDKKFYCLDFNRGKCTYPDSHDGFFNKKPIFKHHICKACWEKDAIDKKHAEIDAVCPHKND